VAADVAGWAAAVAGAAGAKRWVRAAEAAAKVARWAVAGTMAVSAVWAGCGVEVATARGSAAPAAGTTVGRVVVRAAEARVVDWRCS